jgi:hypothetical protein
MSEAYIAQPKSAATSKTMWAAVVIGFLPYVPGPVGEWMRSNSDVTISLVAALFAGLRSITKDRVRLGL